MSAKSKVASRLFIKNKQKGLISADRGFTPCFSVYHHDNYPLDEAYNNRTFINHVSVLVSVMLTTINICDVRSRGGCHEIKKIVPDSYETKALIQEFSEPNLPIYRLKYGDNKMRIILGIKDSTRECFILALDAGHATLNGKKK